MDLDFDTDGDGDTYTVGSDGITATCDAGDDYCHNNAGWTQIPYYTGDFAGNGHTIANLYINKGSSRSGNEAGLFRNVHGHISGLGIIDA